jgi:hypothetical protein
MGCKNSTSSDIIKIYISITPPSFMKFCPVDLRSGVDKFMVHGKKGEREE